MFTRVVPVEKLTPERRRQQTREALIDAAATVFAQRGFNGASLDEIAETAGFTRGAIYKNFTDKEDLFFAVFDRFNQQALQGFKDMVQPGQSFGPEDIPKVAARWVDCLAKDQEFYALELEVRLFAMRSPEIRTRLAAHRNKAVAMIAAYVGEQMTIAGVEAGFSADTVARVILAASEGIRNAIFLDRAEEDLYGHFLELLIAGLAASVTSAPTT